VPPDIVASAADRVWRAHDQQLHIDVTIPKA
jgi:hypothetical protein